MNAASANASHRHDCFTGTFVSAASILALMPADVRNQREIARPLDRGRELALMSGARAAEAAGQDLTLIGDEPAKRAIVLVIDPTYAPFAEGAAFLWSSH